MKAFVLSSLAAGALALGAAQPAVASEFHGITPQGPLSAAEYRAMGANNVGTVRLPVRWRDVETRIGRRNWGWLDNEVYKAVAGGVRVLPVLTGDGPDGTRNPPTNARSRRAFAGFVGAMAARYGPAITYWQIYNEQNGHYWGARANPKAYGKLVKSASKAIRRQDPGAKIVLGGMYGTPKSRGAMTSWAYLKKLYSVRGFKRAFDTVAIHPYAVSLRGLKLQIRKIRRVLKKKRDRGATLRITELGWGSGSAGTSPFNKGPAGQALMLRAAYGLLERKRRAWRIVGADWFAWKDNASGGCSFCPSAGLFYANGQAKPAWDAFKDVAAR